MPLGTSPLTHHNLQMLTMRMSREAIFPRTFKRTTRRQTPEPYLGAMGMLMSAFILLIAEATAAYFARIRFGVALAMHTWGCLLVREW